MHFFMVFIGGGLGSLCRYGISLALPPSSPTAFPWATFWANLAACLALGLFLGWLERMQPDYNLRGLLLAGFCGGFSTFSTFSNEALQLIKQQQWGIAAAYVGLSVVLGIILILTGWLLSK